jgi:hypothetical protein
MSRYKLAVQGLEGSQAISGLLHQCIANELFRTYLGGAFRVFGPGLIDPIDAEPSSITDFNGFVGLAFISGEVTRTNTVTGEVRTLPFVNSDMRFMKGVFRGTDGRIHHGAFGLV